MYIRDDDISLSDHSVKPISLEQACQILDKELILYNQDVIAIFVAFANEQDQNYQDIMNSVDSQGTITPLENILIDLFYADSILVVAPNKLDIQFHGSLFIELMNYSILNENNFIYIETINQNEQNLEFNKTLNDNITSKLLTLQGKICLARNFTTILSAKRIQAREQSIKSSSAFEQRLQYLSQLPQRGYGSFQALIMEDESIKFSFANEDKQLMRGEGHIMKAQERNENDLRIENDELDSGYKKLLQKKIIKSLKGKRWDSMKNRNEIMIGLKNSRSTEEIISFLLKYIYHPSKIQIQTRYRPKIVILAHLNSRLEQIQDTIEKMLLIFKDLDVKLLKAKIQKHKKIQNLQDMSKPQSNFRSQFEQNEVIVILHRTFYHALYQGDVELSEVDFLIIDELQNAITESSVFNSLMQNFYYNSNELEQIFGNPQSSLKSLPKVIGFLSIDHLFQEGENRKLMEKLYIMANSINAELLSLSQEEINQILIGMIKVLESKSIQEIENFKDFQHLIQQIAKFSDDIQQFLIQRPDGSGLVSCNTVEILKKKKLNPFFYFLTDSGKGKLIINDAEHILEPLIARLGEIQQLSQQQTSKSLYKLNQEQSLKVDDKQRYFFSRIEIDEILALFFKSNYIIDDFGNLSLEELNKMIRYEIEGRFYIYSNLKFMKSKQAHAHCMMLFVKHLYKIGIFDEYLRLNYNKLDEFLYHNAPKIDVPILNENKEDQTQNDKSYSTQTLSTQAEISSSINSTQQQKSIIGSEEKMSINITSISQEETKSQFKQQESPQIEQGINIVQRIIIINENQQENSLIHFSNIQQQNNQCLPQDIKAQTQQDLMNYNLKLLEEFVKLFLNPILKCLDTYYKPVQDQQLNKLKTIYEYKTDEKYIPLAFVPPETEQQSDIFIFESIFGDMLSEESFQKFKEKSKPSYTTQENPILQEFILYRSKIILENKEIFAKYIDVSLEKYRFPSYITQHIGPQYYHYLNGHQNEIFKNRELLLTMIIIALSNKEPSMVENGRVKQEMARLIFVGDSAIIMAHVMNLVLSGRRDLSEKDLDVYKTYAVKTENIKKNTLLVGFDKLILKSKLDISDQQSNPSSLQTEREIGDVIKSLIGVFSIYIGFSAAYLLMIDLGIIEPLVHKSSLYDQSIIIGPQSVDQKIQFLQQILKNKRAYVEEDKAEKHRVFDKIRKEMGGNDSLKSWESILKLKAQYKVQAQQQIYLEEKIIYRNNSITGQQDDNLRKEKEENKEETSDEVQNQESKKEYKPQNDQIFKTEGQTSDSDTTKQQILLENKSQISEKNSSSLASQSHNYQNYPNNTSEFSSFRNSQTPSTTSTEATETQDFIQEVYYKLYGQDNDSYREYKFKNQDLLLQAITHKSMTEKLSNLSVLFSIEDIKKDIIEKLNYQILEYLGDTILNFTVAKLFYCETAEMKNYWHGDFFVSSKLHDIKTYFTSNRWLGFCAYQNFYQYLNHLIFKKEDHIKPEPEQDNQSQEVSSFLLNIPSDRKIIPSKIPTIPIVYDQESENFHKQVVDYSKECFKQCQQSDPTRAENKSEKYHIDLRNLSLSRFQDKDVQKQEELNVDFNELENKFMKSFSDVIESVIGAIFLDSENLVHTQQIILKLIYSPFVKTLPITQRERTTVLSIFNSKPYCKGIKLTHSQEEKDGHTYLKSYMGKLEFRRLKYPIDRKRKLNLFYFDMRLYLEDAYLKFEQAVLDYLNKKSDKKFFPTPESWIEFNKDFRKTWKLKAFSNDQKRYSAIKEGARILYNNNKQENNQASTLLQNDIDQLKQEISLSLAEGLKKIGSKNFYPLQALEQERVQSSKIRELLESCGIKRIKCLDPKFLTASDRIKNDSDHHEIYQNFCKDLKEKKVILLYEHLYDFGRMK